MRESILPAAVAYRDVRVNVDRPGFTGNPTSCEPKSVTGTIGAASGESANVARASVALPHSEFLAQAHIRTRS